MNQKKGGSTHRLIILPCLTEKMRQARANCEDLGQKAGVCARTVCCARLGKKIHRNLGIAIYQALNNNKFNRSNIGRW